MMKGLILILLGVNIFCTPLAIGQRKKSEEPKSKQEIEELAEISLQEGKFEKALLLYRNLLENNSQSPRLNFFVGYCYLNTDYGLDQATEYLKNAAFLISESTNENAPIEASYYLAKAYHLNNQSALAIEILNDLIAKIPPSNKLFVNLATRLKDNCENSIMLSQSSISIQVDNLLEFNSKYSDINPLLFNNGKEAIFTSRRENMQSSVKLDDEQYNENIFYTELKDNEWTTPYGLSKTINSADHEAACWISEDGNSLIFRRLKDTKIKLFFSRKNPEGEWSAPEPFAEPIDGKYQQTSGSYSPDGKLLYFTSDRKGGFGGSDIYVSDNLDNNKWSIPRNLGPLINTPYNEEAPFMHENGVLFFCSEGHNSMGGFDVFATYQDKNGNWISPLNLGLPINSVEDDFFYQTTPDGHLTYSSSERKGTKGRSDIYRLLISDSIKNGFVIVSSNIKFVADINAPKDIEIRIDDVKTNKTVKQLHTNSNGNINFILPAMAEYKISFLFRKKIFYGCKLVLPKSFSYLCMDQSVIIPEVNLELDSNYQVLNKFSDKVQDWEIIYSVDKSTEKMKTNRQMTFSSNSNSDYDLLADISATTNTTPVKNQSDTIFSIKIATSKLKIPITNFTVNEHVNEDIDTNGNFTYSIGEFKYEWEALILLRSIKDSYPDASIFVNSIIGKSRRTNPF